MPLLTSNHAFKFLIIKINEQLIKKELREIIKLLPHAYEKPIQLFLTGYSYKEISQYMNIPIGTVKSRIHLGKKQIRKVYLA